MIAIKRRLDLRAVRLHTLRSDARGYHSILARFTIQFYAGPHKTGDRCQADINSHTWTTNEVDITFACCFTLSQFRFASWSMGKKLKVFAHVFSLSISICGWKWTVMWKFLKRLKEESVEMSFAFLVCFENAS